MIITTIEEIRGSARKIEIVVDSTGRKGWRKNATLTDFLCEKDYSVIADYFKLPVCEVSFDGNSIISWESGSPRFETFDAAMMRYSFNDIVSQIPQLRISLTKLIITDAFTRQMDRHCENIKIQSHMGNYLLYPSFDNVMCLCESRTDQALLGIDCTRVWTHKENFDFLCNCGFCVNEADMRKLSSKISCENRDYYLRQLDKLFFNNLTCEF